MNINKEEMYNRALDHAAQRVGEMEQSRWLIEAQANYYLEKYNELLEENNQLKEDLRKLESQPDISDVINNATEENK